MGVVVISLIPSWENMMWEENCNLSSLINILNILIALVIRPDPFLASFVPPPVLFPPHFSSLWLPTNEHLSRRMLDPGNGLRPF